VGRLQGPSFVHQPVETDHPTLPPLLPAFFVNDIIVIKGLGTGRAAHAAPAWRLCKRDDVARPAANESVVHEFCDLSIEPLCTSIFTPAIRKPAAITALTARVTSRWRKAEGRWLIASAPVP